MVVFFRGSLKKSACVFLSRIKPLGSGASCFFSPFAWSVNSLRLCDPGRCPNSPAGVGAEVRSFRGRSEGRRASGAILSERRLQAKVTVTLERVKGGTSRLVFQRRRPKKAQAIRTLSDLRPPRPDCYIQSKDGAKLGRWPRGGKTPRSVAKRISQLLKNPQQLASEAESQRRALGESQRFSLHFLSPAR